MEVCVWLSFEMFGLLNAKNAKNVKQSKFEALNGCDFEMISFSGKFIIFKGKNLFFLAYSGCPRMFLKIDIWLAHFFYNTSTKKMSQSDTRGP